jgi:hypothetical protein
MPSIGRRSRMRPEVDTGADGVAAESGASGAVDVLGGAAAVGDEDEDAAARAGSPAMTSAGGPIVDVTGIAGCGGP